MKKSLFLIVVLAATFISNAANPDRMYRKLIEKYDIPAAADTVAPGDPSAFWNAVIDYDAPYTDFLNDMAKDRGAEKEARQETAKLPRLYPQYDQSIVEGMQGYCDSLLTDMGIPSLGRNCALYVVDSDQANTFTALTDNGFAICITTGLMGRKGVTRDVVMGYVADEFVHGVMQMHTQSYYARAKKDRKEKLMGGLLVAGTIGLVATLEAIDPTPADDYYDYLDNDVDVDVNVNVAPQFPTPKFFFKYLPELEYEADLLAYRFMQYMGKGADYINGLKILGSSYYALYGPDTDQPTIQERINFLEYATSHPEAGRRKK